MAMKKAKNHIRRRSLESVSVIIIILITGLFYIPRPTRACGPFFEEAFFTYNYHPDLPLTRFASGDLGVLQPTYARSYLAVAYRYLGGVGFDKDEQAALVGVWDERLKPAWESDDTEKWTKEWVEARKKVTGSTDTPSITVYRSIEGKDFYASFANCQADGFKTAAEVLNRMIDKLGPTSPEVREWVKAQDQVFSNCAEGANIPAQPPPNAPEMVRTSRAYQIATANFYATNFDAAQKLFSDIAADTKSPFRQSASLLVARSFIRKGTLVAGEHKVDQAALAQAEAQLKKVIADPGLAQYHASANRLLNYVRLRLKPEQQLHELAVALMKKSSSKTLKQDLIDYTLLIDRYVTEDEQKKYADLPKVGRQDDITDWTLVYQVMDKEALDYSLKKYEQTSSTAWLLAAMSKIEPGNPKAAVLVEAASRIKPGSPAFATAAYHSLRLMIETGRKDEARAALQKLLAAGGPQFPPSARNQFMALAARTALSLDEFLKYAQRIPSGVGFDEDGRELPDKSEDSDKQPSDPGLVRFDYDVTQAMNDALPLTVLKEAAMSNLLAPHLRRLVAIAAWTKAVLLDDEATARALAPVVSELAPQLKAAISAYMAETTPDARKFAAIYLMLKFPGTRPVVDSGLGRQTEIEKIDDYRDNWWCAPASAADNAAAGDNEKPKPVAYPDFLTAAQKAKAKQEQDKLKALGPAPNYLAAQAVKWANAKPTDPRAPEALHLAVRSTRFGCKDDQTGRFSKLAYDTLHGKYPKSEWAQKTKYWYRSDQ